MAGTKRSVGKEWGGDVWKRMLKTTPSSKTPPKQKPGEKEQDET